MRLKALLIKDDLERIELLRQSLLEFGHAVVGAATITADLLKRVEATQPELQVIDSDSPDRVLLSRIRELSSQQPLPVVLL
jgi:AmiR/NasT family two-component response regulator